jgi:hypothetical protein
VEAVSILRGRAVRARRAAAPTASRSRSRRRAFAPWRANTSWFGSVRRVNPFWIAGCVLALWALFLAFALGLRSEGFPRDDRQMKTVMLVSIVLTFCAITSAIIGGITGAGENTGFRIGEEAAKHSE